MNTFAKRLRWLTTLSLAALMIGVVLAPQASAVSVWWTAQSGTDILWSNNANWNLTGPLPAAANPGSPAGNDVIFTNDPQPPLITPPTVTNYVSASVTINSLWYSQQDTAVAVHTTQIEPGQVLKISGSRAGPAVTDGSNAPWQGNVSLLAGNFNTGGTTTVSQSVITGASGTLDISSATGGNTGGDVFVCQMSATDGAHNAILDLSGLGTFNANIDELLVGYSTANNAAPNTTSRPIGTLYLAHANTIIMDGSASSSSANKHGLIIGYSSGNGSAVVSTVYLGQSNMLYSDYVAIGGRKGTGAMALSPNLTSGSLTMRGKNTTSRITLLAIGNNSSNTNSSTNSVGNMDLTGVTADILATSIVVGYPSTNATTVATAGIGTLTFSAGTIDTTGMTVALQSSVGTSGTNVAPATGTVNVNGTGILQFGSSGLKLAQKAYASSTSTGTLNIGGGTVQTLSGAAGADIMDGGGISTLSLTGGTIDMAGHLIGGIASPIDAISLANGTLNNIAQINAVALAINSNVTLGVSVSGPLTMGSTYDILNWVTETGTFATVNLPALAPGLSWDSSQLYVDGTIQVVPEPATLLLLIMAVGLGLMFRRTRGK
jgi:hypothetical protein